MEELNLKELKTIRTFSGKNFDIYNPDPNEITIEDIAHSLSLSCRFNGHTQDFYSVAEHCLWVSDRCETYKMEGLLHDATEAYMVDMPSPFKDRMGNYKSIEDDVMKLIAHKYNINYPFPKEVKKWDKESLFFEWHNKVLDNTFISLTPQQAEEQFLETYYSLK